MTTQRKGGQAQAESIVAAAAQGQWPAGFAPFVQGAPLAVMVRSVLEWLLSQAALEGLMQAVAQRGYTRCLTLDLLVELMLDVACGIQPSAHAAYRAREEHLCVSFQALYGKLSRLEPAVGAAVVARTAQLSDAYITAHGLAAPEPIVGYRARIVDGTVLAGHDHRLEVLRAKRAAGLTGMALAVYAPATGLVTQVLLEEDAYTQERALLEGLHVEAGEVWIADRNFCIRPWLRRLEDAGAGYVIRWHASALPYEALEPLKPAGAATEQRIRIPLKDGGELTARRIVLPLPTPTRSGERELVLITNLEAPPAEALAAACRTRWRIETHYQRLTELLHCELPGLGYPRAALFAFAMSVTAANALALVLAALRQAQGQEAAEQLSFYRLVDELSHTWRGLMIALPPERWSFLQALDSAQFSQWLVSIARTIPMKRYRTRPRRRSAPPRKTAPDTRPHHSIQRLLNKANGAC